MALPEFYGLSGESASSGSWWDDTQDFFSKGVNSWLQYEYIKSGGDFSGQNQKELYNTPETTEPAARPTVQPVATVGGIPTTYLMVGGVALLGVFLLAKS